MLKLMYITNRPEIAEIAEQAGVDWIFVDMEFIGKDKRQGGLDTVQNHHTIDDIRNVKKALNKAKVLVRINPIHEKTNDYFSSEREIDEAIEAGADILMLPYFRSIKEITEFIRYVNGRAKTCLLIETPESVVLIDEILEVAGIDMIHIGLNDLHLALKKNFMFELLANGTVEKLARKIKAKGIPFGFGGIASLHSGALPGSYVLKEHYRLGSSMVIVGRSFCNTNIITDEEEIRQIFNSGIGEIRDLEAEAQFAVDYFNKNHQYVVEAVEKIVRDKK